MCPLWTLTTAFKWECHWSTALLMNCWSRLAQQVHTLSFRSSKPTIHRTELRGISVNFSIDFCCTHVVFLTAYQFSYTINILFRSDVLGRPLPAFQENELVVSILCRRSLTAQFLLENSLQMRFGPHPLSWQRSLIDNLSSFVKGMFINKLWHNNNITLCFL